MATPVPIHIRGETVTPPVKKAVPTKAAPTNAAPTPDSPEQAELVEAGARPTQVDVDAMFAQIQKMQEQLNAMNKAQAQAATPDPVSSGVVNLLTHLKAHCDANAALVDRTETVRKMLAEMKEDGEEVTSDDAAELRIFVDELAEENPGTDLSYVRRLARDLHKETLAR